MDVIRSQACWENGPKVVQINRKWFDRHRRYFNLTDKHFQPTVREKRSADASIGWTFRIYPAFCEIGNERIGSCRQFLGRDKRRQIALILSATETTPPTAKMIKPSPQDLLGRGYYSRPGRAGLRTYRRNENGFPSPDLNYRPAPNDSG